MHIKSLLFCDCNRYFHFTFLFICLWFLTNTWIWFEYMIGSKKYGFDIFFYSAYYLILLRREREFVCVCVNSFKRTISFQTLSLSHSHTYVDVVYINDHLAHTHTDGAEKDVEGVWGNSSPDLNMQHTRCLHENIHLSISHSHIHTWYWNRGIVIGSSNRFKTLFMI